MVPSRVKLLMQSAERGDAAARAELFAALYQELHRLAQRELRRNAQLTISPTTLLHETYLNLSGREQVAAQTRTRPILQPVLESAARAALALGDAAAAQRYADDALTIAERNARGPDSSADVGETLLLMARIRLAIHDPRAARALLARAARCLANGLGSDAPLTVEARRMMESTGTESWRAPPEPPRARRAS